MNLNLNTPEQVTGNSLMDGLSIFCYQHKLDVKEVLKLEKNLFVIARLSDQSLLECTMSSPGIIHVSRTLSDRQMNYRLTKECLTWTSALINTDAISAD